MLLYIDITLLGQGNAHMGFFHDKQLLKEFREYSWNYVDIYNSDSNSGRGNNSSSNTHESASGYKGIQITIIVRAHNRYITNYPELCDLILRQYHTYIDIDWFNQYKHVIMEVKSLYEQIYIMKYTDLLISIHGTSFINTLFMNSYSVAIAIMQSHHIEYVLPPVVQQGDVKFDFVYVTNQTKMSHCVNRGEYNLVPEKYKNIPKAHIYPDVCNHYTMVQSGHMECLGIRMCSIEVDLDLFEAVLLNNIYYIQSTKYPEYYDENKYRPI